jgi:hypothetical protein
MIQVIYETWSGAVKVAGSCTYGERSGTNLVSVAGKEEGVLGEVPGAGCQVQGVAHVLIACGRNVASSCYCADRPLRGRGDVAVESTSQDECRSLCKLKARLVCT